MVFQRNAEPAADIGQFGGTDIPDAARQLDRAEELDAGQFEAAFLTAGAQDPSVESGIVGGDEVHAVEQGAELGPQFLERGLVGNLAPGDSVQVGKDDVPSRRSDEAGHVLDNGGSMNRNDRERAGAILTVISGFEVQSNEMWRRLRGADRFLFQRPILWRDVVLAHAIPGASCPFPGPSYARVCQLGGILPKEKTKAFWTGTDIQGEYRGVKRSRRPLGKNPRRPDSSP